MTLRQSTAGTPAADEQRPLGIDLPRRTKRLIIIGAMLGMFMAALEQSVVSPAMPQIVSDLGGLELYPWLVQAFIMAQVVTIPVAGTLSDMFGRKPVLLAGMAIFLLGSALCGFAPGIYELIAFRAVQGVGAAILMTASFSVVGDLYAPAERGRFIGLFGGVFALSSLIGAPIGGVLTETLSWRWVFWIMLFLAPVVIAVVAFKMPWLRPPRRKFRIDVAGVLTLSLMLMPAMIALSLASQWGWLAPQTLILFLVSALALLLFIRIEQRAEQPIVPLQLFKIQTIATAAVVNFFIGVGMMGVFVYLQFYLQVGIGVDAATAGLVMGPMILVSVTGSILSGQVMSRTGRYKILAVTGSLMMFASMLLLSTMTRETTIPGVLGRMFLFGIGMGLMMPVMSIASQNAAPQKFLGIVSAFNQFFQQVGGVIGIGVIGALFNARLASGLMERLAPDLVDVIQPEKLVDPLFRDGLVEDLGAEVWAVAEPQVQTAVATAITDNFLLAAAIVFISVLAVLRMKEIKLRSAELPAAASIERPDAPPGLASLASPPQSGDPFPVNSVAEVYALQLRGQYAPPPASTANGTGRSPSLRRNIAAAAMIGAGLGLVISFIHPRNRPR
ncbi:MAG: MDR family MFS transporter [Chloroflexota bacterium]|nr:MDR family MFS transporter [Chloroflexota bacterium]